MESAPVNVGERVVVYGRAERATVASCAFNRDEARWVIVLDWGRFGASRVYGDDEGTVWYRYGRTN